MYDGSHQEQTERAEAEDRATVVRLMREAARISRRIDDEDAWLAACIEVADGNIAAMKQELLRVEESIQRLAVDVLPPGRKSIAIPGAGVASYRKRPETIAIDAPDAYIQWAKEHEMAADLVRTEEWLQMAPARQYAIGHLKETGEKLPGVGDYTPEDEYGHFKFKPDLGVGIEEDAGDD